MVRYVIFCFVIFFCFSFSRAGIIQVPQDQPSIQAGINSASAGDTVLVADSTYFENINFKGKAITVGSEFIMDSDTSHISHTIIDGSQNTNPDSASVVYFISGEDSTSVLCGFTITGGRGTYSGSILGGGIYMLSGGRISNNIIRNNTINTELGCLGAGIFFVPLFSNVTCIIEDNNIRDNSVVSSYYAWGGGIHNILGYRDGNVCRINNNIISNNSATLLVSARQAVGAGISVSYVLPTDCDLIIANNVITKNEVRGPKDFGGGIGIWYNGPGTAVAISGYPTANIYNNFIAYNYAEDYGGAIGILADRNFAPNNSVFSPQPALINNTIVNNSSRDGCGLFNFGSDPLLLNNILWDDLSIPGSREVFHDNSAYPGTGFWGINNGTITMYNSLVQDDNWSAVNNSCFNLNPLFFDENFYLSEQSPAIGMGKNSIKIQETLYQAPAFDLAGNVRPDGIDGLVDIGAFESTYQKFLKIYPVSFNIDRVSVNPGINPVHLTAQIVNLEHHTLSIFGRITSLDSSVVDSVELYDDGNHGDGEAGDGFFAGELAPLAVEAEFTISIGIKDNDVGIYSIFNDIKRFTSIGPVVFAGYRKDFQLGNTIGIKLSLKNLGQTVTAKTVTVELFTKDSIYVSDITTGFSEGEDILAGQTVELEQPFYIHTNSLLDTMYFNVKIYSKGYHFWSDTSGLPTSIEYKSQKQPKKFYLAQNYPNPFNPKTVISYNVGATHESLTLVDLSIFNVLGQKVATLVSGKQGAGFHKVEWDASGMASGVYYYRLVAGEFVASRKLIVLK